MSDTESSPRPPAVPSKQQDASRVAAKHSAEHGAAMLPPIHVVKTQKAAIQSEATNKPVTFPGFLPESFGEAGSSLRESHCFESERSLQINGDVLTGSGKNAVCDLPSSTGRGLVTTVDNGFVGLSSLPIVDVETVKVAGFTSLDKKSKPITHTFTPVSDLKGWAKLKRVSMHYVKFFQAFRCLRDVHTPWEIEPSLLKKMDKLGEGCFAVCVKCATIDRHGNKRELALKLLKSGSSDQDVDDFIRERNLLRKLRHSGVVEFCDAGNIQLDGMHFPEMYLAMEYMRGGSVRDVILKQMDSPHRRIYLKSDALRWLLDIARALHYLHTRSPAVIHRDLKPENITLSSPIASQACAKLADFGLHCLVERDAADPDDVYELTGNTGSLMYMSPEVFRLEPYNEKADVFSFAINFWELFNCSLMIARITNMGTQEEVYNYACGVANGMRPRIPESWPSQIADLVTDCWDPLPENRPNFREIVQRLQACKECVEAMDNKRAAGSADCCCTLQ